jgi:hypothetical protein
MMRIPPKDLIASCAVGAAVALYLMWVADVTLPGMSTLRVTAMVILVLGFLASAVAVVPSFDQLLHGNKGYLVGTSVLGLVALVAGVVTLWSASATALGLLMAALAALWLISTTHHAMLAKDARHGPPEDSGSTAHQAHRHALVR